jgi:serine/alanine adding enzyme
MNIRFATDQEIADWDQQVIKNPDNGNFLQGQQFALQKQREGWRLRYLFADTTAILVLERTVFGLGNVWYLPKGPGIQTVEQLGEIVAPLRDFAKQNGVFVVKLEPELVKTEVNDQALRGLGLVSVAQVQPAATVILDIKGDLEAFITAMPQKGRYAIRRAERDGVTVKRVEATPENCKVMFDLLTLTAEDSAFGIRNYDYYLKWWQGYEKAGQGQLFFAYFDNEVVAGAYAIVYGNKSTYKDGASIRKRTAYGASHLLQWHVIQWVKERGSVSHDLCGTPPPSQVDNKDHRFYGIGLFKRSFNPEVTEYIGVYELPVKPLQHRIWRQIGEKVVRKVHALRRYENYY